MNNFNLKNLEKDLVEVADKHGISYYNLIYGIREELNKQDTYEDIMSTIDDHYPEIYKTNENLNIIYNRLQKSESSEYGTWDNIINAIDWVYEELEKDPKEE